MAVDPESQESRRLEGTASTGSSTGALLAALGVALCPLCFGFTMGFTSCETRPAAAACQLPPCHCSLTWVAASCRPLPLHAAR